VNDDCSALSLISLSQFSRLLTMAALVPDRLSAIGYRRSADRRQPMAKIFSLATSATIPELAHRRIAIPNLRRPGCPFLNHKEHQGHKGKKNGGRQMEFQWRFFLSSSSGSCPRLS
jgi:hypothetical protein